MIIVSQDRNEIINFENVERIDVTTATNPVCFNINYETNGTRDLLGQYATEEKAKEVLQEITDTFIGISALENIEKDLTFDENTQVRIRPKVYYMPKE